MRHQILTALLLAAGAANASSSSGFGLEVLVDGRERPEYAARGTVYVEALRGRDYALRLSNPTGTRVAVALSVDGLNTLDSRRTSARMRANGFSRLTRPSSFRAGRSRTPRRASSTSRASEARTARPSGKRRISASSRRSSSERGFHTKEFLRMKMRALSPRHREVPRPRRRSRPFEAIAPFGGCPAETGELAQNEPSRHGTGPFAEISSSSSSSPSPTLSDEYAATGMGRKTQFGVTQVDLELETEPAAVVRLRYEFRPQLVALGVLPRDPDSSRIARRERARGFEEFCPEVR